MHIWFVLWIYGLFSGHLVNYSGFGKLYQNNLAALIQIRVATLGRLEGRPEGRRGVRLRLAFR
jgi:hypothetical protein